MALEAPRPVKCVEEANHNVAPHCFVYDLETRSSAKELFKSAYVSVWLSWLRKGKAYLKLLLSLMTL